MKIFDSLGRRYPTVEPQFPLEDLPQHMRDEAGQHIGFAVNSQTAQPDRFCIVHVTPSLADDRWHIFALKKPRVSHVMTTDPVHVDRVIAKLAQFGLQSAEVGARRERASQLNPHRNWGKPRGIGKRPIRSGLGTDLRSVYFVQAATGGPIKIGVAEDVALRLSALQTGNPARLKVVGVVPAAGEVGEIELHNRFVSAHIRGEWFEPTPDLLDHIKDVAVEYVPARTPSPTP